MPALISKVVVHFLVFDVANSDICCRYECIENDLLGSLHLGIHSIAPYKSKGIERASELSVCWNNKLNTGKCMCRFCLNN